MVDRTTDFVMLMGERIEDLGWDGLEGLEASAGACMKNVWFCCCY